MKICASIVTYHPDTRILITLIESLRTQIDTVIVVDNGGTDLPENIFTSNNVILLQQPENTGVSSAHNRAIRWAIEKEYDYITTFDQDSSITDNLISKLLKAQRTLKHKNIGCIGPMFIDPRGGVSAPFIKLDGWMIKKMSCPSNDHPPIKADYLITSGCLMSLATIKAVGMLEEKFFIDYVDIEWGLRAKSLGFQSYGVCDACMEHPIGDSPLKLPFVKRKIPLHSPLRHYYHFRNAILLYKRSYISIRWSINDATRLIIKYFVYTLFAPNRYQHTKMMSLGIWHGLRGIHGKLTQHKC